jgi:hypothetical protein
MPTNPVSGRFATFDIGTVTLPGMDWKLSVDAKLKDVANFADGRHQKGTLPDADFTSKILLDADNPPYDPAGLNIVPGANITAKLYVNEARTKFLTVPLVIGKIDLASEIEGIVMYDISAKQNGPIVWPTVP